MISVILHYFKYPSDILCEEIFALNQGRYVKRSTTLALICRGFLNWWNFRIGSQPEVADMELRGRFRACCTEIMWPKNWSRFYPFLILFHPFTPPPAAQPNFTLLIIYVRGFCKAFRQSEKCDELKFQEFQHLIWWIVWKYLKAQLKKTGWLKSGKRNQRNRIFELNEDWRYSRKRGVWEGGYTLNK